MIAGGAPLLMWPRQLGHAQTSTTANIYAHAIASAQVKAMQTFDRFNDIVAQEEAPVYAQEKVKKRRGVNPLAAFLRIFHHIILQFWTLKAVFQTSTENKKPWTR